MLESIKLENFQSHVDTEIKFGPGVNIITGLSHHGKSSIIKAIEWVVSNRPLGNEMINDNMDEAYVSMVGKNKEGKYYSVERTKSKKGTNTYEMTDTTGKHADFEAFGANPPDDVVDLRVKVSAVLTDIGFTRGNGALPIFPGGIVIDDVEYAVACGLLPSPPAP